MRYLRRQIKEMCVQEIVQYFYALYNILITERFLQ